MDFPIFGTTAPGFEPVRAAFEAGFTDDVEVGAGFCVLRGEEVLVDLWGGFRDSALTRPWSRDTLVNVYSTTKGLAAAAVATLVDAGELEYEAPLAEYWPELRAAADGLTVTQLLSHQAGLCGVHDALTVTDLYDWPAMCRRLESMAPLWPPGTASGYHAVTWSFLVGELVRRVAGMSLGALLRRRIAGPLEADVHLGLHDEAHHRVADLIGPNRARQRLQPGEQGGGYPEQRPRPPFNAIAMENPVIRPYGDASSAAWRRAELAASNGHATAAGVARIYAALAGEGELGSVRILAPATVAALREEVWGREPDLVLGYPMRRGRGVNLNTDGELGPEPQAFGHTGTGGSLGMADPVRGIGVGYVMNQLRGSGPRPATHLLDAVYRCLTDIP
jgi:CubicO group peptidase (beta-lactamase class C family)